MTIDLSCYFRGTPSEGFENIRLNDYQVCELLQDYIVAAIQWVECRDLLVSRITITPEVVRAYVSLGAAIGPEFIEVPLRPGVYARALDLSCGPLSPFPVVGPTPEVQLFLGRLHRIAFPERGPKVVPPQHIVLNAHNYADVRRWLSDRLDQSCAVVDLRVGLQGTLWEHQEGRLSGGGSVKVWCSRVVPVGSCGTATSTPPQHGGTRSRSTFSPSWRVERLSGVHPSASCCCWSCFVVLG
jgi:hypothetical protein